MKKKKIWLSSAVVLIAIAIIAGASIMYTQHKQSTVAHANYINDRTPTLFLHGTSGNLNSLKYIINEAKDRGVTQDVVIAHVSKDGAVTFEGALTQQARNPIVQIELEDNDNMDLNINASWIKNVIVALDQKQHFKHFNFVGHSMGNTSFAQYMLNYGNDTSLPQLKHQVSIAGTYNGVLGMNEDVNEISVDNTGKPSRMIAPYEGFMKLKPMYKGKNIEVLNIYGDILDGTHSDGIVSMSSSKSLKYLLGDSPKSYKESKYEGADAEHSDIHDNPKVANEIISFLWGK
ncbi:alpha/beta hydrolase [Staphylococcus agnetis]|uniref:alpha/beta hydrolase n=1 Tax=Staphylococcus agnetis TaxID=985762 RepID=UPI0021D3E244|nr:alpha/beta hydrolase [Staphylococcus agnetis]UXU55076.1 alpha/beta hydrolase [Staphylococcus agnetis]